ncbi:MAG: type II secretion system protein [Pseudomonadota bacterium]
MSNEPAGPPLIRRQAPDGPRQSGVSLVELILFIVIVGIAVAAVLQVYGVTARANADPLLRRQSLAIAQALMEEIGHKAAANPPGGFAGPYTPANRWLFDDVLDYNGFSMAGIADLTNVPISGLENYRLEVAVVSAAFGPVPISAGLRFTVTVTDPTGEPTVLEGYRASYP